MPNHNQDSEHTFAVEEERRRLIEERNGIVEAKRQAEADAEKARNEKAEDDVRAEAEVIGWFGCEADPGALWNVEAVKEKFADDLVKNGRYAVPNGGEWRLLTDERQLDYRAIVAVHPARLARFRQAFRFVLKDWFADVAPELGFESYDGYHFRKMRANSGGEGEGSSKSNEPTGVEAKKPAVAAFVKASGRASKADLRKAGLGDPTLVQAAADLLVAEGVLRGEDGKAPNGRATKFYCWIEP